MSRTTRRVVAGLFVLGCAALSPAVARAQDATPCPDGLPADTACFAGQAPSGGYYWIARPAAWNGILVMHSHGGPRVSAPKPDAPVEDLQRFAVFVAEGYAWAGSTYRRGGYGVRMAAEDTEELRRIYVARFGRPRLTVAHGQSWGGNVAAKLIELYPAEADGRKIYDAALLTSGVIGGGTKAYQFRADLRAVYEAVCHNHPAPDEAAYPLWQGLPPDSHMRRRDLDERLDACTGIGRKPAERTAEQRRRLAEITRVIRIPERTFASHMDWATFLFADLVNKRLGGRNPFTNARVAYAGSGDDAALNRDVARFEADPQAVKELAEDSDMTGAVAIPVLTLHAIDDPTAFVEHESAYRETLEAAGTADRLVQTFTDEHEHSKLETPEYAALLAALKTWIEEGRKPDPASIAAACPAFVGRHGGACRFRPDYRPASFWTRSYPR